MIYAIPDFWRTSVQLVTFLGSCSEQMMDIGTEAQRTTTVVKLFGCATQPVNVHNFFSRERSKL